jgi:hypothetical protein
VKFLPDPLVLRKWLKRKLALQIAERLALCLISFVMGAIVLAATFALAFAFTFIVALGVVAIVQYFGRPAFALPAGVTWGAASVFMVLLFIANHRAHRDAIGFYTLRNQVSTEAGMGSVLLALLVDPIVSGGLERDILFTGPRLATCSIRSLRDSVRLMRTDLDTAVDTIAVLARRFHRTSLSELSKLLPGKDPMKTLFKLQEMDFVLFLSREPAGVILTLEIREELNQILGSTVDFEPEPVVEEEPKPPKPVEGQEYYDLLGVNPTASLVEIKTAYRSRIKQCHPDKFAGRGEEFRKLAEERAKALNEAYEILKGKHGGGVRV